MELKHCPFCGGRASIEFAHGSNETYIKRNGGIGSTPVLHVAVCKSCFAKTDKYEDVNMAVSAWNRRAE